MYEGTVALLIVFLTHPGILIPIPAPGVFSWPRGLLQAGTVIFMHSFSDGPNATLFSMLYWIILFVWAYIYVAIALARANA